MPLRLVAFQPDTTRIGQTCRVTLALPSGPGEALLPGAFVAVTASVPNVSAGMTVPASALIADNDRSASFLVLEGGDEQAIVRRVEIALASLRGTPIPIEGLESGTEIAAAGAHRLTDGQIVRRFPGLRISED